MQNHLHCPHKLEMDSPMHSDNEKEETKNVSENNTETTTEIRDMDAIPRKKSPSPEDDDNENQSIRSEPLPNDDDEDDDDSILSENEEENEDDVEEMPPELLEKMKIYEEEEKQKELEKNQPKENKDQVVKVTENNQNNDKNNDTNNDINNNKTNNETVQSSTNDSNNKASSKISLQELQKQSKLATQQSLLALGGLRATAEYEKKKMHDRKEELILQLQKMKEQPIDKLVDDFIKQKKFCQLQTTLDQFFELIQLFQKVSSDQQDQIDKLQKEINGYKEEKKDDIQEYEKLMKREDNYWKPNIEGLKKTIQMKNQSIRFLTGTIILSNGNTFLMAYLGLNIYFSLYQKTILLFWEFLKLIGMQFIIFLIYAKQNFFQVIGTLCTLIVIGKFFEQKIKTHLA
jgi:hypothetical protein